MTEMHTSACGLRQQEYLELCHDRLKGGAQYKPSRQLGQPCKCKCSGIYSAVIGCHPFPRYAAASWELCPYHLAFTPVL